MHHLTSGHKHLSVMWWRAFLVSEHDRGVSVTLDSVFTQISMATDGLYFCILYDLKQCKTTFCKVVKPSCVWINITRQWRAVWNTQVRERCKGRKLSSLYLQLSSKKTQNTTPCIFCCRSSGATFWKSASVEPSLPHRRSIDSNISGVASQRGMDVESYSQTRPSTAGTEPPMPQQTADE